jgi:uncharacterized protein (TIGR02118 family)
MLCLFFFRRAFLFIVFQREKSVYFFLSTTELVVAIYIDVSEGGSIMIQLTVLYGKPQDSVAFDHYYQETHAALAQKIPGLKGYVVNKPAPLNPQEQSPYYLIGELYFESMTALQTALQSPEGQAAAGDLQNFATGGATLVVGEVQAYKPISIN